MKHIELTITSLSPLAIGRQKPGSSISETENYIPGSVIRGAIAAQILKQAGQESANLAENGGEFQALFLGNQPAIFQNGYPAVAKVGDEAKEAKVVAEPVGLLPATAVSSKAKPGFLPGGDGVFDTLIDRFCAEAHCYSYDPSDPKDLQRVEPFGGFYSKAEGCATPQYRSHSVSTRFLTRVGINRKRATAEDEILYSIEALNESFLKSPNAKSPEWEPAAYRSAVSIADDALAESFLAFVNRNAESFRLGGSTSRGLGKTTVSATERKESISVSDRIQSFNQKLHDRWQLCSTFGQPTENLLEGCTYFTIDLQSDAILIENWQRTIVLSEGLLKQFTNIVDDTLKLHVSYSSYDYRSGWNSAWGLMKDMELVTNKGAVYLFSTANSQLWESALSAIEEKGVGDRTCEGFGQVQICNEFHTVFREDAV
ncbi:type III-D CRISPR-associated RAMP protein Csx10 [Phormidesmis priestleyi]